MHSDKGLSIWTVGPAPGTAAQPAIKHVNANIEVDRDVIV